MGNYLFNKVRYVAPYDYLINFKIIEFDLEKANISVLREANVLSLDEYNEFLHLPKYQREVKIGYLLRNKPYIVNILQNGIIEAKRLFFLNNNIEDQNVLYIDNDSITLIFYRNSTVNINTQVSNFLNFKQKNEYSSFYRINSIDFLYYNNESNENFRLKNCNQNELISKHNNYFLDILLSIAYQGQSSDISDNIDMISTIYKTYVNLEFDINYYREFNQTNKFKINSHSEYSTYYTDILHSNNLYDIDISYNANIIRLFYKIFMRQYFQTIN